MKTLTLAIWAAALSAGGVAHSPWSQYSCDKELISYQLPSAWQVQNEHNLEKIGYLSCALPRLHPDRGGGAGDAGRCAQSPFCLHPIRNPQSLVHGPGRDRHVPAPSPEKAYELGPEGEMTIQEEQGLDPSVIDLTQPRGVSSGGIRGSEDRSEVIVPGAGSIELDEVVYTKGHTAWIAMAGCTVACYNANSVILSGVIRSIRVGTATV